MWETIINYGASPAASKLVGYAVWVVVGILVVWLMLEVVSRRQRAREFAAYRRARTQAAAKAMARYNILDCFIAVGGWGSPDKRRRYEAAMEEKLAECEHHGPEYVRPYSDAVYTTEAELAKVLNWYVKAEINKYEPR